jgi:hypothetical protein
MPEDKWTEEKCVNRFVYSPLIPMQFAAMQTPRDTNRLDAWTLRCANPIFTYTRTDNKT